jgi:hypothetical protein
MYSVANELAEIDKLIREGKLEEAKKRMAQYLEQINRLAQDMRGGVRSMMGALDDSLRKELDEALSELQKLRESQQALLDETDELRNAMEKKWMDEMTSTPLELEKKIAELQGKIEGARKEAQEDITEPWHSLAGDRLPEAKEDARRLRDSVKKGQILRAREDTGRVIRSLNDLIAEGRRLRGIFDRALPEKLRTPSLKGLPSSVDALQAAEEIRDVLRNIQQQLAQKGMSQKQKQTAEDLTDRQGRLQGKTDKYQSRLEELGGKIPGLHELTQEQLKRAKNSMNRAGKNLGEGKPSEALPNQRDAVASLEQLEQSLKGSQENQGSQGGFAGLPGFWGGGGQEGAYGQISDEPVLIPEGDAAEDSMAWRKKVMDAMKEKPPEGYEDITRKYLRELAQ